MTKIEYNGSVVATIPNGNTATLPVKDKKMKSDIVVTVPEATDVEPYLTFSSPNSFTLKTYNNAKNWDGTLEYSTDTTTWSEWDGTTTLSADNGKLYMRGTGNTLITGFETGGAMAGRRWVLEGSEISCIGNIENLLDYATVANGEHPTMSGDCYTDIFYGCTSLVTAPELPATTLADYCYFRMFCSCTSLTTAPVLPATTLVEGCYMRMFSYCTGITIPPELPATTLAKECYEYMFSGCRNLKLSTVQEGKFQTPYRVPTSGEGTTADKALSNMFGGTGGTFTGTPEINTTYYLDTRNTVGETLSITENGTYDVVDFVSAEVNVEPALQEKTVTENGEVTADSGYTGLSKVIVNVESEVIPEFTEVEDFAVFANGADEGSLELAYSVSQDVKLSAASPAPLVSIDDANFIANNIKKDVSIFGLTGAYEAEDSPLPIEVSTEAEMTALLESGEVGGVYKYTGETTVTYENGALYVIEEDLLQGVWVFNDTIAWPTTGLRPHIDFVSNGKAGTRMIVYTNSMKGLWYRFEDGPSMGMNVCPSAWRDTAYQTVNISTTFAKLSANYAQANEFLAFMQTNATRQSNSFTKLINPSNLEEITITENGEYTPNGDGFSKVKVDVPFITEDSSGVLDAFISGEETEIVSLPTATKIKAYAFYDNDTIQNIEMPNVTNIGNYAFYGCTNLDLTELPSGLTGIGESAFYNCDNLALTELPSGVININGDAFYGCTGITSLTFKGTPTFISSTAFDGCTNLTTINVPWAEGAVAGAPWGATNATINYNYTGE